MNLDFIQWLCSIPAPIVAWNTTVGVGGEMQVNSELLLSVIIMTALLAHSLRIQSLF